MAWIGCELFPGVQCCGSCHYDAEEGYDEEMHGIYEDEVVAGGDSYKLVGSLCCGTEKAWSAMDESEQREMFERSRSAENDQRNQTLKAESRGEKEHG